LSVGRGDRVLAAGRFGVGVGQGQGVAQVPGKVDGEHPDQYARFDAVFRTVVDGGAAPGLLDAATAGPEWVRSTDA
jgi:hypothetical protein